MALNQYMSPICIMLKGSLLELVNLDQILLACYNQLKLVQIKEQANQLKIHQITHK